MLSESQDTRTRLVRTALALFATRGYHNTGIAEILKESGVNRGALYYHFSCKKELGKIITDVESMVRRGMAEGLISDGVEPRLITGVFTVICEGVFLMSVLGQRQEIWEEARGWLREYLTSLRR